VTSNVIRIVAALVVDNQHGGVLLVRKRGTKIFMQPGGKRNPGESDLQALDREVREELGCGFSPSTATFVGLFSAEAPNEPDHIVEASLYRITLNEVARPSAEIEELLWADPKNSENLALAPLTRQFVLPIIIGAFGC
jgi:8-oxo-dGTP diphosphatase